MKTYTVLVNKRKIMYGQVKSAQVILPEKFKLQSNIFDSYVKIANSNDKYANTHEKHHKYVHPIT